MKDTGRSYTYYVLREQISSARTISERDDRRIGCFALGYTSNVHLLGRPLLGIFPHESQFRFDWCYSTVGGGGSVLGHLVKGYSAEWLSCLFAVVRCTCHWFRGMHHYGFACNVGPRKWFQVQFRVSKRATHPRGLNAVWGVRSENNDYSKHALRYGFS